MSDLRPGEDEKCKGRAASVTSSRTDLPLRDSTSVRQIPTHVSSHSHNQISLRDVDPVSITLDHLSVSVDQGAVPLRNLLSTLNPSAKNGPGSRTKTILDNVSAHMGAGTLTAIIGSSGSGKTSLLNVMSGRMRRGQLSISGRTLFNGSEDVAGLKSAYVIQQDLLLPTLTVRETLTYAAQLRLPASISKEEKRKMVEEVIMELGLKEAADTRIGNHEHRGCSGGEKRRTSIGVQVGLGEIPFLGRTDGFCSFCPIQVFCG